MIVAAHFAGDASCCPSRQANYYRRLKMLGLLLTSPRSFSIVALKYTV